MDRSRSWGTPVERCFFRPLFAPLYKHKLGWQQIMELPQEFADTVAHKVGHEIELRNSLGEKWTVVLRSFDSTVALGKGWRAFVDSHNLEEFDLLVFRSIDSRHFKVQVYSQFCQDMLSSGVGFYKPLDQSNWIRRLVLPSRISARLAHKVGQEVELENALGEHWTVRISPYDGRVAFARGWKEFAKYHNLVDRDILVFKGFNKGSLFEVQVFDGMTFCEKVSRRSLVRAQQEECSNRKRNTGTFFEQGNRSSRGKGAFSNKGSSSQPQVETELPDEPYRPVTCRAVTSGKELEVIGLPPIFDSRGKKSADIKNVKLLDDKNRLWPATYQPWDGILRSSWGEFAAVLGVEDGDMYSFAVYDKQRVIYKISALRSM